MTSTTSKVIKTTGWKKPSRVSQYAEYGKVNTGACYQYSNLENICESDGKVATIPTNGVNNTHGSPRVFCYDYGFNVPSNAVITRVVVWQIRRCGTLVKSWKKTHIRDSLVKLKVGASVTDGGVGTNFIKKYGPVKWNAKTAGLGNNFVGEDGDKSVEEIWGVKLTPAMVNSPNFGCIVQCMGSTSTYLKPELDSVRIQLWYEEITTTNTTTTPTKKEVVEESLPPLTVEANPYLLNDNEDTSDPMVTSLEVDRRYDSFKFYIRYVNEKITKDGKDYIVKSKSSPISITCSDHISFEGNKHKKIIPARTLDATTDESVLERGYYSINIPIELYPQAEGTARIIVDGLNYIDGNNQKQTRKEFEVYVLPSKLHIDNSFTDLSNVTFSNCDASNHGGAICNHGRIIYENIDFNNCTPNNKVFYDHDKYRDGEF